MAKVKQILTTGLAVVGIAAIAERGAYKVANDIAKNIDYRVDRPSTNLDDALNGKVFVKVPIGITNNNSFSIKIDGFIGKIFYGETYLSSLSIKDPLTLTAHKHIKSNLGFEVDINKFMTSAASNYIQNGLTVLLGRLYLKGEIKILSNSIVGSLAIPIDVPIPIV